jgi:predicted transcriptional regulator YdeE
MYEITKSYIQKMPGVRFAGIRYGDEDRTNGGFGLKWMEWFEQNRFDKLEKLLTDKFRKEYQDADAYLGFMKYEENEPFQYWIGIFLPENTQVPEEYEYFDIPDSTLGVCWIKGQENDIYCKEDKCKERLVSEGYETIDDGNGTWLFFECYGCSRFTQKDEEGKIILDICHYIK